MTTSGEGLPTSDPDPLDRSILGSVPDKGAAHPPEPAIEKASCSAVVTAYRPPAELRTHVAALLDQFHSVTVVDDGSQDGTGVVESCRDLGADIVLLETNSGIGAALNAGVTSVRRAHPEVSYIVTFDQDSLPPANMLDLYEAARTAAGGLQIGSISPESVSGSRVLNATRQAGFSEVREPIQSGLLVPVQLLDSLGGFDEGLFIDGVDTDFYWKLRSAGRVSISAPGVALEHSLGSREQATLLGRPLSLPSGPLMLMQSAPFRYYYLGRNRVHLLRRYLRAHPAALLRGLALDLRHVAVVGLLGSRRRERLGNYLRGIRDGLSGRTGKVRGAL